MITVIGAGLAGSEAAWYLAQNGADVELVEQKPVRRSPAHMSNDFCELVCSNSLKSDDVFGNACGLLKEEMRRLGSLTMEAAAATRVPAGGALAVDRERFSAYVTEKLRTHPKIHIACREADSLPESGIVATGPLTDGALYEAIAARFGGGLHFYDATAPVVTAESVDLSAAFTADRYGRGTGDYVNCPMNKEEYETFVRELLSAEKVTLRDFEKREIFEGCMPVEVMASRGKDSLRFGTFKPVGLEDEDGKRPYAVLQLRRENEEGTLLGLVGCQTNLKFGEQKRVFSLIPALRNAEFVRYGVMHRNTFLHSPGFLNAHFEMISRPQCYFAGQMTGVEGYVESAASGLLCGLSLGRDLRGLGTVELPGITAMGAMGRYVSTPNRDFQPMNCTFGLLDGLLVDKQHKKIRNKQERYTVISERSLSYLRDWVTEMQV